MSLRRSGFIHLIDLAGAGVLVIHAVTQMRLTVTRDVADLIEVFAQPHELDAVLPGLMQSFGAEEEVICGCVARLRDRGILVDQSADEEVLAVAGDLARVHGRDPAVQLDRYRRAAAEGGHPYWSVTTAHTLNEAGATHRRLDIILLGDCDVQMEADFLRREAARRGIDLRVAASFASDTDLAGERRHDAVVIGALQARHAVAQGDPTQGDPALGYLEAMGGMLGQLRALTDAPILIDGLSEPSVQPLGFADRGLHSHRNRFRRVNLALAQLAEDQTDVHLVDVAAALAGVGNEALLDDGLVSFTHFGSLGWMLQRPESEFAAVHGQFPDLTPLAKVVGGDPYRRETLMARVHMDGLAIVLGIGRKKCVIVDLDGVLWPGVLAETGSPFAWTPEVSGPNSYIGLYFGLHEALRALADRGILLACVSKNDEATVRRLWHYPDHLPHHRLLRPEHFVTTRINWQDKAENIRSIAEELGFAPDAFVFIDDTARERARVREALPDVTVWGEDLFAVRRMLLTDPGFQPLHLTQEGAARTALVRAQLDRARLRTEIPDVVNFVAFLAVEADVERLLPEPREEEGERERVLARVQELIGRTTQFNATGRGFSGPELQRLIAGSDSRVFILRMRDRLGDHGLVGVAVVVAGEILNVVLSCRVIGLGGEAALLDALRTDPGAERLVGLIVQTDRNLPVRNFYADHGFSECMPGRWLDRADAGGAAAGGVLEPVLERSR